MRELKILAVVVVFTLITYYLVEPFAHSQMHKHVESEGFTYKDLKEVPKGNAANGEALAAACMGCHSIKSANIPAPMDALTAAQTYGVNPPDLSLAGKLLDEKFFAHFLVNPAEVTMSKHFSMPPSAGSLQDAADIVAYFKSIAPKEEVTSKEAYEFACGRCHANRYANWTQIGEKPKFKTKQDELKFELTLADYQDALKNYMGKLPPDLSIYIRSRGEHYIKTFVENPQAYLHGTAMPRVGITEEGADKVIEFLEESGDYKLKVAKEGDARDNIAPKVMIYLLIFALFAYLWKKEVWRDLH